MTHEEMIAVIQAHKEGKTIQYRPNGLSLWTDCDSPIWNFNSYDYRIKPEPHYRPYKSAIELFADITRHGNYVKDGDTYRNIKKFTQIGDNLIVTFSGMKDRDPQEIDWMGITFADGTPFGVKED